METQCSTRPTRALIVQKTLEVKLSRFELPADQYRHCSWYRCISITLGPVFRPFQNCCSTFGNIPSTWNLRKLQNTLNRSFQMRIPSRPLDQCAHGQPDIWFIGDLNVTSSLSVLQQGSHLLDQFAATQAHTQRTQIGFLRSLRAVWNWNGL